MVHDRPFSHILINIHVSISLLIPTPIQPLELSMIQSKLKESGLSVSKDKLMDFLDQWVSVLMCLCMCCVGHKLLRRSIVTIVISHK